MLIKKQTKKQQRLNVLPVNKIIQLCEIRQISEIKLHSDCTSVRDMLFRLSSLLKRRNHR